MTTGTTRSPASRNRYGMASSQSQKGGTGNPLKRINSSANSRKQTVSVSSKAGK